MAFGSRRQAFLDAAAPKVDAVETDPLAALLKLADALRVNFSNAPLSIKINQEFGALPDLLLQIR